MVSILLPIWAKEEDMTFSIRRFANFALMLALMAPAAAWGQSSPNPKLVEAAKKEGEGVYYTIMTLDQSKSVTDRFEKKYGIRVTLFRTGGGPLLNKIFTESRGGRHEWDVVVGRGEMVLPMMQRKLLASYMSPETKMIDEQLVDKEGFGAPITSIATCLGGIPSWSSARTYRKL
jgi:ABC-type thiamine transport system substrate-binding protein